MVAAIRKYFVFYLPIESNFIVHVDANNIPIPTHIARSSLHVLFPAAAEIYSTGFLINFSWMSFKALKIWGDRQSDLAFTSFFHCNEFWSNYFFI